MAPLGEWLRIWHPHYRGAIVVLGVLGLLSSGLTYTQNWLLGSLTQALGAPGGSPSSLLTWLAALGQRLGVGLPFIVLALFVVARLGLALLEYLRGVRNGALTITSRNDAEREVLAHLLHKDDSFFGQHAPAEIVNRLALDLSRAISRRTNVLKVWWAAVMLLANLAFFAQRDWRLALVAVVTCAAGTLWIRRIIDPVQDLDREYLEEDDAIKARFEDYLRTAPEAQAGWLYEKIRTRFSRALERRTDLYHRFSRMSSVLTMSYAVTSLVAFLAAIGVVLYMRHTGSSSVALALIPVVIWVLPDLFSDSATLIFLRLDFQLAATSLRRLAEYSAAAHANVGALTASAASATPAAPVTAAPLRVEGAAYRYPGPDGLPQGGIADVTTSFTPGRWVAVVGAAGSGKSTLLQLVLGRQEPQEGRVRFGDRPLAELPPEVAAGVFTLMPQRPALLDASIRENVTFGRTDAAALAAGGGELTAADLVVMEQAGLGAISRLKALGMRPPPGAPPREVAELRDRARALVRERCGLEVHAYEDGPVDPRHWVIEALLRGTCDRDAALARLLGREARRPLAALGASAAGAALREVAGEVLAATRSLLELPTYDAYARLAAVALDERVWRLRRDARAADPTGPARGAAALALVRVALTAAPGELEDGGAALGARLDALRQAVAPARAPLVALLGDSWAPLARDRLAPHLCWRDNLLFGVVPTRNQRTEHLVDEALLELVGAADLRAEFTRLGLEYGIGRGGERLSGGQGQLVALCRALLRPAPVVILDEPTSALDPQSRARVAALLRARCVDRVLITVSHDRDLVREADEVRLMAAGRLVASGSFAELEANSEVFRRTLRIE